MIYPQSQVTFQPWRYFGDNQRRLIEKRGLGCSSFISGAMAGFFFLVEVMALVLKWHPALIFRGVRWGKKPWSTKVMFFFRKYYIYNIYLKVYEQMCIVTSLKKLTINIIGTVPVDIKSPNYRTIFQREAVLAMPWGHQQNHRTVQGRALTILKIVEWCWKLRLYINIY